MESIKKIFSLIPLDQFEHEIIWAICINYELIPIIKSYLCKINLILTKLPFIDSLLIYNLFKEGIISKEQILHAKIAFKFEESLNNDNKSSIHEEKSLQDNEKQDNQINNNENNNEEILIADQGNDQNLFELETSYDLDQKVRFAGKLAIIIALDKVEILDQLLKLPQFSIDIPIHIDDQQYQVWEIPMLSYAAQHNSIKCFKLLLLNGADPNIESKSLIKWNTMSFAASKGNFEMINILIEQNKMIIKNQVAAAASKFHQNSILNWYILKNLDLSEALLFSAEWNNIEAVEMCLKAKANVNVVDSIIKYF